MHEFKLFNRWSTGDLKVNDIALNSYINLKSILVPRTQGRSGINRIWTNPAPIVERLMNKMTSRGLPVRTRQSDNSPGAEIRSQFNLADHRDMFLTGPHP